MGAGLLMGQMGGGLAKLNPTYGGVMGYVDSEGNQIMGSTDWRDTGDGIVHPPFSDFTFISFDEGQYNPNSEFVSLVNYTVGYYSDDGGVLYVAVPVVREYSYGEFECPYYDQDAYAIIRFS